MLNVKPLYWLVWGSLQYAVTGRHSRQPALLAAFNAVRAWLRRASLAQHSASWRLHYAVQPFSWYRGPCIATGAGISARAATVPEVFAASGLSRHVVKQQSALVLGHSPGRACSAELPSSNAASSPAQLTSSGSAVNATLALSSAGQAAGGTTSAHGSAALGAPGGPWGHP
jgi:hypothetical protein